MIMMVIVFDLRTKIPVNAF